MKQAISIVLLLAISSLCWGELSNAPKPQNVVEHDPGAWFVTGMAAPVLIGCFTKPSIGLAGGIAIDVLANLQNSKNAHQNMIGAIGGSVAGYLLIKTLKKDWRKH